MIQRHGWTLLFHAALVDQLARLSKAVERVKAKDPQQYESNSNYKLFSALSRLMLETIPLDPGKDEYRQGTTLGPEWRHWRRAKVGRRFRLFYRYDSATRVIVYAWVNDTETLRSAGSKRDPYEVFRRMLERGNPPDTWKELVAGSTADMGLQAAIDTDPKPQD